MLTLTDAHVCYLDISLVVSFFCDICSFKESGVSIGHIITHCSGNKLHKRKNKYQTKMPVAMLTAEAGP